MSLTDPRHVSTLLFHLRTLERSCAENGTPPIDFTFNRSLFSCFLVQDSPSPARC